MASVIIEPLAPYHDRDSFTCGTRRSEREMNAFLRLYGAEASVGKTFVVVPDAGSAEIIAYFTLVPNPEIVAEVPVGDLDIQVLWLKCLAVAKSHQRQGIGERILVYVIEQAVTLAEQHEIIQSLMLEAIDDAAKGWYLRRDLGFRELAPGSLYLILPLATLRGLRGESE